MPGTAAIKVIDASALAALVFDEPEGDEITERIRNCELVAPSLLRFRDGERVLGEDQAQSRNEREALLAALQHAGDCRADPGR